MQYDLYLRCCKYDITVPPVYRESILRSMNPEDREQHPEAEDEKWNLKELPFNSCRRITDTITCSWLISCFHRQRRETEAFLLQMIEELLWMLNYTKLTKLSEVRVIDARVINAEPVRTVDEFYTYDDLYLDLLSTSLRIHDDSVFAMNNYQQDTRIRAYGNYICSDDLIRFLNYNLYDHSIKSYLSYETIFHLIDFAGYESTESQNYMRENLKFVYIDSLILTQMILEQYDRWISERYSDIHRRPVTDTVSDPEQNDQILIQYETDSEEFCSLKIEKEMLSADFFNIRLIGIVEMSGMEIPIAELGIHFFAGTGRIQIQAFSTSYTESGEEAEKTLEIPFEYTSYAEDQFYKYGNQISDILKLKRKYGEPEYLKQGKFELIYLFGEKIHDLKESREIYFNNEFMVDTACAGQIRIRKNRTSAPVQPDHFFGDKINAIHALIGRNGSGKSSLLDLLCSCEVFGAKGFSDHSGCGKYFLIFKIDHTFYYVNNTGRKPEFDYSAGKFECFEGNGQAGNVTICKISNIFELYDKDFIDIRNSQILDLTTQYTMTHSVDAFESERLLLENYQRTIQTTDTDKTEDEFNNKILPDFNREDARISLSSGERARLSLFSRILTVFYVHERMGNALRKPKATPYYIFLLDEAELYFHPAWQKRLIADLSRFFDKISQLTEKNPRKFSGVTLILTSNSPFYMSDLPDNMIHLLPMNGEQEVFHGKSFGQHIYTLLKDKFFMEDGVIGTFAYKKIQETINLLKNHEVLDHHWKEQNSKLEPEKKEFVNYILSILGDPLMRQILEQMLERKEYE